MNKHMCLPATLQNTLLALATAALLAGCSESSESTSTGTQAATNTGSDHEVWMIDQSDSPGRRLGGTLYIYPGEALGGENASTAKPSAVIDLGAATTALCRQNTGANPVRPHMVLFNEEQTHAMVAFVASGHVAILDAASREPVACLRMSQSASGQQAHAAFPAPDGSYVIVANQNGKRLERIDTDFAANIFVHNEAATLDLANCETPSGQPCEADGIRPDNAPICPVVDSSGDLAFVTLRGGGMLVVDPRSTPMAIVAEYDMATVKGNGCGGIQVADQMYINSGGRPGHLEHLEPWGFDVYRFPLADFARNDEDLGEPALGEEPASDESLADESAVAEAVTEDAAADSAVAETLPLANSPAPVVIHSAEGEHDSHGMVATGDNSHLWVMDRHADVVQIFSVADDSHVGTVTLNGSLTDNAAPDLTDISPDGSRVYVALRGPTPLSGDPHSATGTTPGLGILAVQDNGASGELVNLVPVTNVDNDGVEQADPHGLRVRRLD